MCLCNTVYISLPISVMGRARTWRAADETSMEVKQAVSRDYKSTRIIVVYQPRVVSWLRSDNCPARRWISQTSSMHRTTPLLVNSRAVLLLLFSFLCISFKTFIKFCYEDGIYNINDYWNVYSANCSPVEVIAFRPIYSVLHYDDWPTQSLRLKFKKEWSIRL